MKTCETCKFWDTGDNVGDSFLALGLGKCRATKMFWDSRDWSNDGESYVWRPEAVDKTAFVQDGSDYVAHLYTKPTHGCTMHEEKPNAQGERRTE